MRSFKPFLLFAPLFALSFFNPLIVRSEETFVGPDACSACHAEVFTEWKNSVHSKAFTDDRFHKAWEKDGKRAACLECHTTGHKKGTIEYAHSGVTCESCHGALADGHPGEKPMPVPISSDMCKTCHQKTFLEWKVSKHGIKNIRCFDCHNVHGQGLRAGGGDKLCGSCHAQRQKDFAHATHSQQGLHCTTCHMPQFPDKKDMMNGTGAAGHALSVGAEVCSRCHEETVHKSSNLPELRGQLTDMKRQMSLAGVENAFDLKEKVNTLEWKLDRSRQSVWVAALLCLLIGLALGWIVGWVLLKRRIKDE